MLRGRPPTDFASKMVEVSSPFPAKVVDQIAARFRFAPDFPLKHELDHQVAMLCRILAARRTPNREELSRRLELVEHKALAVRAGRLDQRPALAQLLNRSSQSFSGFLFDPEGEYWEDQPPERKTLTLAQRDQLLEREKQLDRIFTATQLDRILDRVRRMRAELPPAKRGPDRLVHLVVNRAAAIWTAGTGRSTTASKVAVPLENDPEGKERHELRGAFVDFLEEVACRVGLEKSREALWKAWERRRRN